MTKGILHHLRKYIFRGLLAVIPLALTVFAVGFLYIVIDRQVMRLVDQTIGFSIPGLGILLVGICLYLIGLVVSNVFGRQMFSTLERISKRVPLVNTTYQIGKQLSEMLSLPERRLFKRAVLVEYLKPGTWTVGFVTGNIIDRNQPGESLLKVFIPMPPNPTSGTMVIVRESQTKNPGWKVEEALRVVISGGLIGPEEIQ